MQSKTILIVDDVDVNLDILENLLNQYNIIKANNGSKALKIAKEENIHLIILDIMMPSMDGYEVCKKLKQDKKTKNIPVLFITASTEEKTLKMAYEVGGVDYITKPFNTTELLARVSTQLDLVDKTYNLQNLISKQLEEIRNKDALLIEQSKKAEMGQMIATITHQLKQPLNVVSALMSSALIDDMLGKNVDIDRIGLKVQDEITFMSETIDMYRTFFSTNQEKRYTSLSKVVDDTLYIMTGNIIDVTFIKEYQENLEMIKVYKNELIQCVMNIIKNAQDNQNEKKISKKIIKISTYKDGDYQVITIHDNGGGIPSNIKDKIFNNYFTTKSEDNGTGIGLYLVKQIIEEKHNGQVYVENQELEYNSDRYMGAKFFIKLREDNE